MFVVALRAQVNKLKFRQAVEEKLKTQEKYSKLKKQLGRAKLDVERLKSKDERVQQLKKELANEKIARQNDPLLRDAQK